MLCYCRRRLRLTIVIIVSRAEVAEWYMVARNSEGLPSMLLILLCAITPWYMVTFRSERQIVFRIRRSLPRDIFPLTPRQNSAWPTLVLPPLAKAPELEQSQLWATRLTQANRWLEWPTRRQSLSLPRLWAPALRLMISPHSRHFFR